MSRVGGGLGGGAVGWIGVVADTHRAPGSEADGLPPALLDGLAGTVAILHAGDIAAAWVLETLGRIAPVHAVGGNADAPGLRLPGRLLLTLQGVRVGLTHGHLGVGATTEERARRAFPEAPLVVVFGHSHRPLVRAVPGGPLLVNPGSPTQPRGRPPTFALLQLPADPAGGEQPTARLVTLPEDHRAGAR